ncbi:MAG: TetR/AcrR family transcriptional regulator [Parvibaculaceae bacterium]|nr:TetR/AcrR family transcriptional regulator [Parvibaculaceae bacterium]
MITHIEKPASKTRQRITNAALELFVAQGIAATTTRDIAAAADIAEGTIYRHFESKEALAQEIFMEGYMPFAKALVTFEQSGGTVAERLARVVEYFYGLFDTDQTRWVYLMTYQTGPQSKLPDDTPTPHRLLLKMLTESVKKGEMKGLEPKLTAQILLGIILQPADGIVYGQLQGPLSPRAGEVMQAIGKVLTP